MPVSRLRAQIVARVATLAVVAGSEGDRAIMDNIASESFDMRAYLERIGLARSAIGALPPTSATLRMLHEAHLFAVPFENLSIHYGQPIVLSDEALYDKIVRRRRGGFCYELNGMFTQLLRRLGFSVRLLSAGVAQGDGSFSPAFDHLTLQIYDLDGADWLADVGFGDSFLHPLRLQPEREQDGGAGLTYRFHVDGEDWTLEQRGAEGWAPQYRFTLRSHPLDDFLDRCAYQQTSPESHFTQKRLCTLALPDGRITLSDLRLITTRHGVREERTLASEEEFRAVLAERFGITIEASAPTTS